jgi:hypothetical protein
MVEVTLQHIIGTVALIGLVISAGLFYTIFTSFVQDGNIKKQLGQISENVALNMEEMLNLIKFSQFYPNCTAKIIDLPTDVGGRTYKIQLNDTNQGFQVSAFLATQPTVSATSTIPCNSGDIHLRLETTETVYSLHNVGADNLTIACSGTIYGKPQTVIWAYPDSNLTGNFTIGIGWVEG